MSPILFNYTPDRANTLDVICKGSTSNYRNDRIYRNDNWNYRNDPKIYRNDSSNTLKLGRSFQGGRSATVRLTWSQERPEPVTSVGGATEVQIWIPDWSAIISLILWQMLYIFLFTGIHVHTSCVQNQNIMVSCQCLKI